MRHVISIKSGIVRALYTDVVDFKKLGSVTVERASNVEYDNHLQGWTVQLADGTFLSDATNSPPTGLWPTRQAALDAEVKYLQERVL
jgi:hypothetical protein